MTRSSTPTDKEIRLVRHWVSTQRDLDDPANIIQSKADEMNSKMLI